jgi:hypothetical protein
MKKTLFLAFALTATTGLFVPNSHANANKNGTLPYISANNSFPPTRADIVRHTFEISNPNNSKQISQIMIQVPEVVKWSSKTKDVIVTDKSGKKVNVNVSIKDQNIELNFPESIAPGSELEIDIKNVKRVTQGNGPVYRLFAKFDANSTPMSIGIARFRLY